METDLGLHTLPSGMETSPSSHNLGKQRQAGLRRGTQVRTPTWLRNIVPSTLAVLEACKTFNHYKKIK